jgi:hypothetical protein
LLGGEFLGAGVTFPSLAVLIPKFGAGVLHKVKNFVLGENQKAGSSGGRTKKIHRAPVALDGVSISELLLRKWRGELLEEESVSVRNSTELRVWFECRVFK